MINLYPILILKEEIMEYILSTQTHEGLLKVGKDVVRPRSHVESIFAVQPKFVAS